MFGNFWGYFEIVPFKIEASVLEANLITKIQSKMLYMILIDELHEHTLKYFLTWSKIWFSLLLAKDILLWNKI